MEATASRRVVIAAPTGGAVGVLQRQSFAKKFEGECFRRFSNNENGVKNKRRFKEKFINQSIF